MGASYMSADNIKTLSFYPVNYVSQSPKLDGKLSDKAWKDTPLYTDYYEYFKPNPNPSTLKTGFKMLYDAKGIYLAIFNYDKNLDKLKAVFTTRDADKLWCDDCDEIYFDAIGSGVGFTKFVVNSIGTVSDMKRLDAAVTLDDWSGSGWRVVTGKTDDAWTVEAFFPWDDLGQEAKPGQIWRFCNVRYAYTSGKFQGATSSPGGSYMHSGNHGFIYFLKDGETADKQVIGKILKKSAAPPWQLPLQTGYLINKGEGIKFTEYSRLLKAEKNQIHSLLEELSKLPLTTSEKEKISKTQVNLSKLLANKGNTSAEKRKTIKKLSTITSNLNSLKWEAKVTDLVEKTNSNN